MKFTNLFLAFVFAATLIPAQTRVIANVDSVQVEGNTFRARGKNLTSSSNPAKAWVQNLDGTNKTNLPINVNRSGKAVFVTMPLVEVDTKMNLFISGGNVPEADPQQYFIVVLNNPDLVETAENLPTVVGSEGSTVGGTTGPQGPQGDSGPRGLPGFIYDGTRDVDSLPDYSEGYGYFNDLKAAKKALYLEGQTLTAGQIEIGEANAVTVIDSNTETDDILGLIQGSGATGQRVTFIVDNFFFVALSERFAPKRPRVAPVVNSIVAPNFFDGPFRFPQSAVGKTIDVDSYQLMPVFPGQVLEFIFDGTQWRLINLPFFFGQVVPCQGLVCMGTATAQPN
jgi:hypothetical protein